MKTYKEHTLVKGWFIGNFEPTVFKTSNCEVAVKRYLKNEREAAHYHKIATEITYIVSGSVKMNDIFYKSGDIILIEPYEKTDFTAIEDTITVVVKVPSSMNDKYIE